MQPKFIPEQYGGLWIFEEPQPKKHYVVSSDAAEGLTSSDKAAAQVLELETGSQVAEWEVTMAPSPWAYKCCMLAAWYNEAWLVFETGVSAHGVSAANTALRLRYPKLYRRRAQDTTTKKQTDKLGWATTVSTKPLMIDHIRGALANEIPIFSTRLVDQLQRTKLTDPPKVQAYTDGPDDLLIAYGVALCVRIEAWNTGMVERTAPGRKKLTFDEQMAIAANEDWEQDDDAAAKSGVPKDKQQDQIWDGSRTPWAPSHGSSSPDYCS